MPRHRRHRSAHLRDEPALRSGGGPRRGDDDDAGKLRRHHRQRCRCRRRGRRSPGGGRRRRARTGLSPLAQRAGCPHRARAHRRGPPDRLLDRPRARRGQHGPPDPHAPRRDGVAAVGGRHRRRPRRRTPLHVSSFFLHVSARESLHERLARARQLGLSTSLDTNDDPDRVWASGAREAIAQSDVLFVNDSEAVGLAGFGPGGSPDAAVEVLLASMPSGADPRLPAVVHKRGAEGASVRFVEGAVHVGAPDVTVVDTVGAGDTLAGTVLAALLSGAEWPAALALGVAAASLSTRGTGGVAAQASARTSVSSPPHLSTTASTMTGHDRRAVSSRRPRPPPEPTTELTELTKPGRAHRDHDDRARVRSDPTGALSPATRAEIASQPGALAPRDPGGPRWRTRLADRRRTRPRPRLRHVVLRRARLRPRARGCRARHDRHPHRQRDPARPEGVRPGHRDQPIGHLVRAARRRPHAARAAARCAGHCPARRAANSARRPGRATSSTCRSPTSRVSCRPASPRCSWSYCDPPLPAQAPGVDRATYDLGPLRGARLAARTCASGARGGPPRHRHSPARHSRPWLGPVRRGGGGPQGPRVRRGVDRVVRRGRVPARPGRDEWPGHARLGPRPAAGRHRRDGRGVGRCVEHGGGEPLVELVRLHRYAVELAAEAGRDADRPHLLSRSVVLDENGDPGERRPHRRPRPRRPSRRAEPSSRSTSSPSSTRGGDRGGGGDASTRHPPGERERRRLPRRARADRCRVPAVADASRRPSRCTSTTSPTWAAAAGCDRGFSSVMFDAGARPYGDNVRATRAAADWAHDAGLWVEAELGHVGGKDTQIRSAHAAGVRTDPLEARAYVDATGVDALAVAVGSSHAMRTRSATARPRPHRPAARREPRAARPARLVGCRRRRARSAVSHGITQGQRRHRCRPANTTAVRAVLAADSDLVDPRRYLGPARPR